VSWVRVLSSVVTSICRELGETIERLEEENSSKYDEIKNLESNLGLTKAECRQYQAELSVINQVSFVGFVCVSSFVCSSFHRSFSVSTTTKRSISKS
jgi:transposase-like protein